MLRLVLVVSALVAGLTTGTAAADQVRTAEYELSPGLPAVVHHPARTDGTHPLVVMLHGLFATCSNRNSDAHEDLFRWPCPAGINPIPSYRGYDYLGRSLAEKGFVVVSINANKINGGHNTGDEFADRADLINDHLRAWQQRTGPLARFSDVKVDLANVGVLGHSKGGRATVYHSSDAQQGEWPAGVQVKAVVALEPIPSGGGSEQVISNIPFLTVRGNCDRVSSGARQYFEDSGRNNTSPLHMINVHGANHNFFNTVWSPSSGEVDSGDDADHEGVAPGNCRVADRSQAEEKQLSEREQRAVGDGYLSGFFQRYLKGDKQFDPMLTGAEHPFEHLTKVDVEFDA